MNIESLKQRFQRRTIARDLTLGLIVTIFLVTVSVALVNYFITVNQVESDLRVQAEESVVRLAGVLSVPLWNVDIEAVRQSGEVFLQTADVVGVRIWDERDTLIYDRNIAAESIPQLAEERPILFDGRPIGRVEIAVSTQPIIDAQRSILLSTASLLAFVIFAVAVVNQFLLGRFLNAPLEDLTKGLDKIAGGAYEHRIAAVPQEDLNRLSRRANLMAEQIEARDQELRQFIGTLEERVASRTERLEMVAVVGGYLNSILELDKLLMELVEQVKKRFDYYNVLVYLLDEEAGLLRVAAGTGAAGRQMLAEAHTIPLSADVSLVGRAARTGTVVNVADVSQAPDWLSHKALPETKSEMAVPIVWKNSVLGVLDVQENRLGTLDEADANVLRSLSNQVATAIRNAQLFQETIAARQEAERANLLKTEFLSNMSHELRTPLNAIINFTGFVVDGLMGEVNESQKEALQQTIDSGQHLLSLINDVLDLSKIEAGLMTLIFEDVDLNEILDAVVSTATGLAKDKPVAIYAEIEPDLPAVVGDKRRLRQVFLNLTANAVKYTMEGRVTIHAELEGEMVHVGITDTGIGIAPEDHDMIFQSFAQAREALGTVSSTGLGLPITKQLLEMHGGEIWLESEQGVGSTFHVRLPLDGDVQEGMIKLEKETAAQETE